MLTPTPSSSQALGSGAVTCSITEGIATVSFYHPKSNSLPAALLADIAGRIASAGKHPATRVVVIRSEGAGSFCAGASFDELIRVTDAVAGEEFFSGFARVILAMIRVPKLVLVRVHGRTAGGGVGIAAAGDYAFAIRTASAKLSELAVGIGPFVVGPVIERRIGPGPYAAMAVDVDWREAAWCERHGLYARVFEHTAEMDGALNALAGTLAASNPDAMAELKRVFWEGTEQWEELLARRARISGRLVLSKFTRGAIEKFRGKGQ